MEFWSSAHTFSTFVCFRDWDNTHLGQRESAEGNVEVVLLNTNSLSSAWEPCVLTKYSQGDFTENKMKNVPARPSNVFIH